MWQSTRERVGGCQVFRRVCVCMYMWVCIYYPISSAVVGMTCASKLWRCGLSPEWGMRQGKCGCIYLWTYGGPGVTPHGLPLIKIGWLTSYYGHQEQPWGRHGGGGGECCPWAQYLFQSMTGRRKRLPFLLHLFQDGKRKLQGYSGSRNRKGKLCPKGQVWAGSCPKVRSFCTWIRSVFYWAHAWPPPSKAKCYVGNKR